MPKKIIPLNEIWIGVIGNNGYEVSNIGRVRSLNRYIIDSRGRTKEHKGRILKQWESNKGYFSVEIAGKQMRVNRLVAFSFNNVSFNNGLEANHLNGMKGDNNIGNLELCTRSENQSHACRVLGHIPYQPCKGKFGKDHYRSKPICAVPVKGGDKVYFEGIHHAARVISQSPPNICAALRGRQHSCGGYIWEYL